MKGLPSITIQIVISFAIILADILVISLFGFIVGALFLIGLFIVYYFVNKRISRASRGRAQSQSF